jgi:large conductance mechanosensitive channel
MSRISAHSLRDGGIAVLKGFRQFIAQGNVLDLAVAVVIGGAFALVIKGLVDGIINPLIAAIFGKPDLTKVGEFTINGSQFSIGLVLAPLFTFLVTAAAIYFFVIVPYNAMKARMTKPVETVDETPEDVALLREIRDALKAR